MYSEVEYTSIHHLDSTVNILLFFLSNFLLDTFQMQLWFNFSHNFLSCLFSNNITTYEIFFAIKPS